MTKERFDYDVRCNTCFEKFTVQLFESHEKNLWLADHKDWYCDSCKKEYFEKKRAELARTQAKRGFPALTGTPKRVAWAEKIRADLINKVDFLKQRLVFTDETEKESSDQSFQLFLQEWQTRTQAKWWIDHRQTTVRDISNRIAQISKEIKSGTGG